MYNLRLVKRLNELLHAEDLGIMVGQDEVVEYHYLKEKAEGIQEICLNKKTWVWKNMNLMRIKEYRKLNKRKEALMRNLGPVKQFSKVTRRLVNFNIKGGE